MWKVEVEDPKDTWTVVFETASGTEAMAEHARLKALGQIVRIRKPPKI